MVCQNCQSTDIVSIQGQNYCINCGQMVTQPPKPSSAVTASVPAAAPQPIAAKAASAPVLVAKPPVKTTPKPPVATKPVTPTPVAVTSASPKATAQITTKPPPPPNIQAPIKPVSRPDSAPTAKPSRQLSDIRPAAKVANPAPIPTQKPPITAQPASVTAPAIPPVLVTPTTARLSIFAAFRTALRRLLNPSFVILGLPIALTGLLPLATRWLPDQWQPLDAILKQALNSLTLWAIPASESLPLQTLTAFGVYFLAAYFIQSVFQNAIAYGSAKLGDNRSVHPSVWRQAGTNSTWATARLDLLLLFWLAVVALAGIGLLNLESLLTNLTIVSQLSSLVVWVIAAFIAVGLIITNQLARTIIVLSEFGAIRSMGIAWRMWRKKPGGLLLAGLLVASSYAIGAILLLGLSMLTDYVMVQAGVTLSPTTQMIALACLTLITATYLSVLGRCFWTAITTELVRLYYPAHSATLLSGRSSKRHPAKFWLLILFIVGLLTLLIYLLAAPPHSLPRIWTGPIS